MHIQSDSRGEVCIYMVIREGKYYIQGDLRGEVCMHRVIREGKYIYRVIQEGRAIFWGVIVPVILRK